MTAISKELKISSSMAIGTTFLF